MSDKQADARMTRSIATASQTTSLRARQPGRPSRRRRALASACAAAVGVVSVLAASAYAGPPSGSPSLAAMAIAASDLAPGARVSKQGYSKQSGFSLYYERQFRSGASFRRAHFLDLEADVGLTTDPGKASLLVAGLTVSLKSKQGRAALVKEFFGGIPHDARGLFKVTFGGVRRLGIGDEAVIAPMSVNALGLVRVPITFAVVRVDRVIELVILTGMPATKLANTDVAALLRIADGHIAAGLTPTNLTPPTITGTPQSGQTLTATAGTWTNSPTSYIYTWLRCDTAGANCQSIPGGTTATYVVTDADVGSTLGAAVTATNAVAMSAEAQSAATAVVTPAAGTGG